MKVQFRDSGIVLQLAKAMKKYIRETGGEARQAECLELCSRMFGYSGRAELYDSLTDDFSPPDGRVDRVELQRRVIQYLSEIEKTNFDRIQAWDLICGVKAGPWLGIDRFMEAPPELDPARLPETK